MSTKIHDAYRLPEGVDALDFVTQLRELLTPIRQRLVAQELVFRAVEKLDAHMLADVGSHEHLNYSPMVHCAVDRAPANDDPTAFSMSIGRDPQTGRLLALAFTDERAYLDAITALDGVEEYSFWDNADRPDEVSEGEWKERRKLWDRLLPGDGVVYENMPLEFTLRPSLGMVEAQLLIADSGDRRVLNTVLNGDVTDRERRSGRLFRDTVAKKMLADSTDTSDALYLYLRAHDGELSGGARSAINTLARLLPEVTVDALFSPPMTAPDLDVLGLIRDAVAKEAKRLLANE